ncbi:hypothetical protein CN912_10590 [Bacillus cereus]|nr:hypothetical protein CN912_10590 [Bacillus cereus]
MKRSVKKGKKTGKYFYIVDIVIDPLTGKRKQKKKRGFTTKKEAENALIKLLLEFHTGTYVEPSKLSYCEYLGGEYEEAQCWYPNSKSAERVFKQSHNSFSRQYQTS